jgi:hypothetical protein
MLIVHYVYRGESAGRLRVTCLLLTGGLVLLGRQFVSHHLKLALVVLAESSGHLYT